MLPGSAFWLDFEGSFRSTTVWINGVVSATHICGYTPFRVRLDNITAVTVGGENVIAVFVDPGKRLSHMDSCARADTYANAVIQPQPQPQPQPQIYRHRYTYTDTDTGIGTDTDV